MALVALNGFFVLAEFALVKVRKTRLQELVEDGHRLAARAQQVTAQLDAYLSATQLGITLASLGLGWLGEPAVARLLVPLFDGAGENAGLYAHTAASVVAFVLITFLHIVLGELVPKSLAIQRAERAALFTAVPIQWFYALFYPVIAALNGVAALVLRALRVEPANEADLAHSEEELRMLVSASQERGVLDPLEGELLDNVFSFAERVAREIMVPRQDMVCLFIDDPIEESLATVQERGHTRYPVCEGDKDHVVGLVHIRDLLYLVRSGGSDLRSILREVLIVPEGMSIATLLQEMRRWRTHM
ncbi:MAG: HlyC/CorC family transporter, partial [Clostridia bacterium]|nr:HlyC/CorC family transporter [Clostridia bacterium]